MGQKYVGVSSVAKDCVMEYVGDAPDTDGTIKTYRVLKAPRSSLLSHWTPGYITHLFEGIVMQHFKPIEEDEFATTSNALEDA